MNVYDASLVIQSGEKFILFLCSWRNYCKAQKFSASFRVYGMISYENLALVLTGVLFFFLFLYSRYFFPFCPHWDLTLEP